MAWNDPRGDVVLVPRQRVPGNVAGRAATAPPPAPAVTSPVHRRVLELGAVPRSGLRLRVEHQLTLWSGQRRLDFRHLIGRVAGSLQALDPGDPRARRLPSGVALTTDGWEAVLATPPLPLTPGAPRALDDLLRSERTWLRAAAPTRAATRLTGLSTHLHVSVPDARVMEVGRLFVESCAPALAAITELEHSPGILVRPHVGGLEVSGEYVEGLRLLAAVTLLAACVTGLQHGPPPLGQARATLPSRLDPAWFFPPAPATDALDEVWEWARPWCLAIELDPGPVELLTRTARRGVVDDCTFGRRREHRITGAEAGPRTRAAGFRAETEWLTWDHVVWLLQDAAGRQCRAVMPVEHEGTFLVQLDSGRLDRAVLRMLRRSVVRRRRLDHHAQLAQPGLWHDVRPGALVPVGLLPEGAVAPAVTDPSGRPAATSAAAGPSRESPPTPPRRLNRP